MAEHQFGPYRLVRQIAVGGMAEIHLAKAAGIAGFEKYVALKMIHPNFAEDEQFIQMLVDEAKIAVQLTHGNIAQTFDLGRVGETYYITMEYVDGADLYKVLRSASEQDLEMPLDVCAFVGKEVSSALDHAHRKRDHAGKSLGIVHRDVSPQNVLVSYSGEVKLVDFGIAKAAMKARQTAAGVIKGKYYYMSPEQAWGDPIDHRSDIFSAGIVLYEMITGQMLYLEEDLRKLLEMARRAEIAPPSKLRRGVPPQLERIVMHALAKLPGDRYQSAGDFATDLERFLHGYSPVFTASKLSTLVRKVIGDPVPVPDDPAFRRIEFRDGVMSTHPIDDAEVAHAIDRDDLRDQNSVIFRVSDLQAALDAEALINNDEDEDEDEDDEDDAPTHVPEHRHPEPARRLSPPPPARVSTPPPAWVTTPSPARPAPAPPTPSSARPSASSRSLAPRETRATDAMPTQPARPRPSPGMKIPSIVSPPTAKPPSFAKPRQLDEETRRLETPAPANPLHDDSSGLLTPDGKKLGFDDRDRGDDDELEHIGERTLITAVPGISGTHASGPGAGRMNGLSSFMMDFGGDDDGPIEATLVTTVPSGPGFGEDEATLDRRDVPNAAHDFAFDSPTKPSRLKATGKGPPPAALSANIHAPALSELRKPRASRRTPPGGAATTQPPSVLHAIVSSQVSEPMPAPRPPAPPAPALPPPPAHPYPMIPQSMVPPSMIPSGTRSPAEPYAGGYASPSHATHSSAQYQHDASGMPMGLPTPPGMVPNASAHLQPSAYHVQTQGMPPGYAPEPIATQMSPHGYPQMSPGALYQFQPNPQGMSLTGQMRMMEIDEIPSQYKLGAARRRWFTYIVSGMLAVSVAAAVTFLIIRSTREAAPTMGSVHVESDPSGADVLFDGTRLPNKTPLTVDGAPVGSHHTIRVELPHHTPYEEDRDIPRDGREISVRAELTPLTGKLVINCDPKDAEIWINGELRGRAPTTLLGLDLGAAKHLELRVKGYRSQVQDLVWPADGKLQINAKLVR